jgi:pyruvate formate lyase activating enzyme
MEIARKKLYYVYIGNVCGVDGESTICQSCKKIVIGRNGYKLTSYNLTEDNHCNYCGTKINITGTCRK